MGITTNWQSSRPGIRTTHGSKALSISNTSCSDVVCRITSKKYEMLNPVSKGSPSNVALISSRALPKSTFWADKTSWLLSKLNRTEWFLEKAIEIDPSFQASYVDIAFAFISRNQLSDAESAINSLEKINPNHFEIMKLRKQIEQKKERG